MLYFVSQRDHSETLGNCNCASNFQRGEGKGFQTDLMTVGNHFVRNIKRTCNSENAEPFESCLLRQNLMEGEKKIKVCLFFPFLSSQMELSSYESKG